MKLKYRASLLGAVSLVTLMSGCALTHPTNHDDICAQLKRQIIYNGTNLNLEARATTSAQFQQMVQRYRDNHCE